jgi:hypothetical protein
MQKVLILSYFFPPCNLTAGQRAKGWAEYLHQFGYHPIVITRNWDKEIKKPSDVLKSSGNALIHEVKNNYEVYFTPYQGGLRDKLFTYFEGSPLQKISRIFTFFELFAENLTTRFIPHRAIYNQARSILKANPDLKKVIITGNPFNLFQFGYLLKKEFDIQWIADYRDDWNTSEVTIPNTLVDKFMARLQKRSETKWVSNAAFLTTISPHYAQKIGSFNRKDCHVLLNGFEEVIQQQIETASTTFVITYNGSLYASQPIEPLIKAFDRLVDSYGHKIQLSFHFPGLAFDPSQKLRVERVASSSVPYLKITQRIPKKEVLEIQHTSDLLVMIAHKNLKGIPSSKLYEYIGLQKPVLLYPNDHDIIEETLNDTGLGLICNSEEEIYSTLVSLVEKKLADQSLIGEIDQEKVEKYSRRNQTKVLAELLDTI